MVRIAVIEKEKCNPVDCGYVCLRFCPMNRTGRECMIKADTGKAGINEELCTGCGICTKKCPTEAIHIINLPDEVAKQPIHQYGKNGFRLYNLPIPIFGSVVGILGKNGIGKSTAIKILAGVLKPNLGDLSRKETNVQDLIDYFKGTEAQIFFEKMRDSAITVSYKPQEVDLIPKSVKGKVRELLRKVDEKGAFDEMVQKLGLEKVLDTDVADISGGELQRVAIAATVLKKANFYIFDEPSSYLDIKQRIRVSAFIKGLANEHTAVMVVEHDLIILDYMTDLMHLMYGTEGAYGIVSLTKASRAGINTYLSGYLRDENIRFRDNQIKFEAKPPMKARHEAELTSWKGIEKRLGSFHLSAPEGSIDRKHAVGVLGENGIGKTSFVKILAGVMNPDKGESGTSVKVSYKPQYIRTESQEIVALLLRNAIEKYEIQLIRPLALKHLLTKSVSQLSGGELQRVMIATCLSADADLYLLDEPSAFLDVEQRLIVSKVIQEHLEMHGKSALVVDHDLLFIDYLSDQLMLFTGVPAEHGRAEGPFAMEDGMNLFLKDLDITLRRDPESHRPRINKPGSKMDEKQKDEGKRYYI